jgi:DNA-binding transcriptional MerR regulator
MKRVVTKRRPSAIYADAAADIAQRFGITIKTLRHYEKAGLLRPVRDRQGWRSYGQVECERLHLILLLRRFGFSIARIATILLDGAPDIGAVLSLQEQALRDQRTRIDEALILIKRAKARLDAGHPVDPAALAELARTAPSGWQWSAELDRLAAHFFSAEQRRDLAETASTLAEQWTDVIVEVGRLAGTSPDSPDARMLGGKAAALITKMTGGDAHLRAALVAFWRAGFADPALAPTLPLDEAGWRFLGAAMAAHLSEPSP